MNGKTVCLALFVTCSLLSGASVFSQERMLSHDVYFTLQEKSVENAEKLIAACKKYLSGHPGTVWFAAGPLATELARDVNDQEFNVALHVVFQDKAAHDTYQVSERHLKFIEENQTLWSNVRVFDSYVVAFDHGTIATKPGGGDSARKLYLPDLAAGFAGMVQGKVVRKGDAEIVLQVEKILRVWKASKAKSADSLLGKAVVVTAQQETGKAAPLQARFLKSLQVGETISIDVGHRGGEVLTILELTDDQRQRAQPQ